MDCSSVTMLTFPQSRTASIRSPSSCSSVGAASTFLLQLTDKYRYPDHQRAEVCGGVEQPRHDWLPVDDGVKGVLPAGRRVDLVIAHLAGVTVVGRIYLAHTEGCLRVGRNNMRAGMVHSSCRHRNISLNKQSPFQVDGNRREILGTHM